jgi:hypothetical protein
MSGKDSREGRTSVQINWSAVPLWLKAGLGIAAALLLLRVLGRLLPLVLIGLAGWLYLRRRLGR